MIAVMNKKGLIIILAVAAIAVGVLYEYARTRVAESAPLDEFAQCLADKNVIMYGAEWCSYCQNEKNAFGSSFRLVPYVECPENPQECLAQKVDRYPTWVFPASPADGSDDRRFVGEQGLKKLSEESGCVLPPSNLR